MIKMLIGMIKMKSALKKLSNDDLSAYPDGYIKFNGAIKKLGPMGEGLMGTILMMFALF